MPANDELGAIGGTLVVGGIGRGHEAVTALQRGSPRRNPVGDHRRGMGKIHRSAVDHQPVGAVFRRPADGSNGAARVSRVSKAMVAAAMGGMASWSSGISPGPNRW